MSGLPTHFWVYYNKHITKQTPEKCRWVFFLITLIWIVLFKWHIWTQVPMATSLGLGIQPLQPEDLQPPPEELGKKILQLLKVTESSCFIDLRELKWGEDVEGGGWNEQAAWDAPWYWFLGNGYLATYIHLSWLPSPSFPPTPSLPPIAAARS